MRPSKPAFVFSVIAMVLLAGACSDRADRGAPAPDGADETARPNTYSSEVDGVSVTWPEGWHRITEVLDSRPPGNDVQILALATFDGAEAGQCSSVPDGAMARMGADDVLFMLRASDGSGDPRPPRPQDLLAGASAIPAGGCYPEGVEAWRMQFQEHGRPYEALVAAKPSLSEMRRAEIQEIWKSLRLTPIDDGRGGAVIGRPYWHALYTHCGIRHTSFDGREWVADPELRASSSEGNPPAGWGNPGEHGTIELTDDDTAVFTSRDGKRSATFRPRTPQDPPLPGCA